MFCLFVNFYNAVVLLLCFVFLVAACRCPMAAMPKLVVRQATKLFSILGNMYEYSICRGMTVKNSSRGISIIRGKMRVAFLKPNFFVSVLKILFRSFF